MDLLEFQNRPKKLIANLNKSGESNISCAARNRIFQVLDVPTPLRHCLRLSLWNGLYLVNSSSRGQQEELFSVEIKPVEFIFKDGNKKCPLEKHSNFFYVMEWVGMLFFLLFSGDIQLLAVVGKMYLADTRYCIQIHFWVSVSYLDTFLGKVLYLYLIRNLSKVSSRYFLRKLAETLPAEAGP